MDLRDLMASLLRRWYLVIVAVLLTGLTCGYVAQTIGPTYSMSASVLLIPPADPSGQITNRYLSLGSTGAALQVLSRSLSSDPTHHEVIDGLHGADYVAEPDPTSSAPMLLVTVTAKSPADARTVLTRALDRAPQNLATLQQSLGIAAGAQIQSQLISKDTTPKFKLKPQLRPSVTVGVLLLALFAGLIAGIDALLSPSRRRGRSRSGEAASEHADDDQDTDVRGGDVRSIVPPEAVAAPEQPRLERRFR